MQCSNYATPTDKINTFYIKKIPSDHLRTMQCFYARFVQNINKYGPMLGTAHCYIILIS